MAWWQEPLRAVTLEFPASDVATIDVKAIVDETARGRVNLLCVFATGYYPGGTAFYPGKKTLGYPGLDGRDLLQETIGAARSHGQKVIAYVASIWGRTRSLCRPSRLGAAEGRWRGHQLG